MFGGLAFLVGGNMAVAASGQGGLLARGDPARSATLVRASIANVAETSAHTNLSVRVNPLTVIPPSLTTTPARTARIATTSNRPAMTAEAKPAASPLFAAMDALTALSKSIEIAMRIFQPAVRTIVRGTIDRSCRTVALLVDRDASTGITRLRQRAGIHPEPIRRNASGSD